MARVWLYVGSMAFVICGMMGTAARAQEQTSVRVEIAKKFDCRGEIAYEPVMLPESYAKCCEKPNTGFRDCVDNLRYDSNLKEAQQRVDAVYQDCFPRLWEALRSCRRQAEKQYPSLPDLPGRGQKPTCPKAKQKAQP